MTLPKETIDRIKVDAEANTNNSAAELRTKDMEYAAMIMRLFGYKEGYIAGATEWAGKAQGLVDALKWIKMHCPIEPIVDDAIDAALDKYKEVTNG